MEYARQERNCCPVSALPNGKHSHTVEYGHCVLSTAVKITGPSQMKRSTQSRENEHTTNDDF